MKFFIIYVSILASIFIFCLISLFITNKSLAKWIEVQFLHENNLIDYDCLHKQEDLFNYNRYKKSGCPALTKKLYKAILYIEVRVARKELENEKQRNS